MFANIERVWNFFSKCLEDFIHLYTTLLDLQAVDANHKIIHFNISDKILKYIINEIVFLCFFSLQVSGYYCWNILLRVHRWQQDKDYLLLSVIRMTLQMSTVQWHTLNNVQQKWAPFQVQEDGSVSHLSYVLNAKLFPTLEHYHGGRSWTSRL